MVDTQNNDDQRPMAASTSGGSKGDSKASSMPTDRPGETPALTDQLREQASTQVSGQKERLVQGLTSVAEAVRETGKQLRDKEQPGIAGYLDGAANQIARFSQELGQKDLKQIVDDVQRFAQRQPALFVGVGFGIGLLGARFLKSSKPTAQPQWQNSSTSRVPMGNSYRPYAGEAPGRVWTDSSAGFGNAVRGGPTAARDYSGASMQPEPRLGERRQPMDTGTGRRKARSEPAPDPSFQER